MPRAPLAPVLAALAAAALTGAAAAQTQPPRLLGRPAADTATAPPADTTPRGTRILGHPAAPADSAAAPATTTPASPAPASPPATSPAPASASPASPTTPSASPSAAACAPAPAPAPGGTRTRGRTPPPPPRLLGRPASGAAELPPCPPASPNASATAPQPAATRGTTAAPAPAPAAPTQPARILGRPAGGATAGLAAATDRAERAGMRRVPAHCDLGAGAARDPLPGELRCWYNATGPGLFGLLSYLDVPVYQPVTPLPGTHVVGIPGLPAPREGESYEAWEWRLLKTDFGAGVQGARREMELLDPVVASKALRLEALLRAEGIPFRRRETWRAPERQAWIFQQGRSRPGPIATSTLTSWHCRVDRLGRPAGRALDYDVPASRMPRFHALAAEAGLQSYGADSNDPGHVYYVGAEFLTPAELQILRTIPRVPHVTLETGRPDGEAPVPGGLRWHQERERAFLAEPAVGVPSLVPQAPAAPRAVSQPAARPATDTAATRVRRRRP